MLPRKFVVTILLVTFFILTEGSQAEKDDSLEQADDSFYDSRGKFRTVVTLHEMVGSENCANLYILLRLRKKRHKQSRLVKFD